MKNSSGSFQSRSEVFPSPGTPNCRHGPRAAAFQKGWSSERVPLSANCSRISMGTGAYLPYGNGRVLPSKWEDAEKWIFSPVAADGVERSSLPPARHRRPKSKSGPLGPHGYLPSSPIAPCFDVEKVGSFAANSPFSAGVLVVDRSLPDTRSGGICCAESARPSSAHADLIMRSASIHGCSETLLEPPSTLPTYQNEIFDYAKEVADLAAMKVFMKDVATQMSPVRSSQSSPKHAPSFMASPFSISHVQELDNHFKKLEIRDVQVDNQVTLTRWPKKQISRCSDKCSTNVVEFKQKTFEAKAFSWKVSETAKCLSKSKREEAKINAWENLQKAKAEAAIRKLEMKLEKKRSSSMERILRKLRSAQKKAGEMRIAAFDVQKHQVAKTTKKPSYFSRNGQISSLSGCFTCQAF
ncbi:hypothetical protein HPP92_016389 [Vanilla planifolia]|uniref:Remorin C-terminal domain-containing protein n=1 Tax=Vanilla planifolia TaxID=51239 RepID=A0A835UNE8_VANPL|nr:hypothetical protein HPP92_016389 [Vanilla planifolia]